MNEVWRKVKKAWLQGAALIVLIVAGDIAARTAGVTDANWLLYLVWGLFMVAVYITTRNAPEHKLVTGMSHTLTISLLFALSNWIQWKLGVGSGIGEKGFGIIFSLIYVTSFIPALIAAIAGLLTSVRREG